MSQDITPFETIRRTNPAGNEFWSSRDFAKVLGYADYRNFQAVIESTRTDCFNSGQRVEDHFVEVTEMVEIGSGGTVGGVWRQPARLMSARLANDPPNRRPGCRHSRPTIELPTPAMPAVESIKKLESKARKALKKPKS